MKKQKLELSFLILTLILCSCQKEVPNKVVNTEVDVYMAGYVADLGAGIPAYWKNGKLVLIGSAHYNITPYYGLAGAGALSIAVSGNNVYLAGYEVVISPYRGDLYPAICWKNGMPVALTAGSVVDFQVPPYPDLTYMWQGGKAMAPKTGKMAPRLALLMV